MEIGVTTKTYEDGDLRETLCPDATINGVSVALSNSALRKRLALSYCFFLPTFLVRVHPLASAWLQLVRFTSLVAAFPQINVHVTYTYAKCYSWHGFPSADTLYHYHVPVASCRMSRNNGNRVKVEEF